jgi:hypothetical protein
LSSIFSAAALKFEKSGCLHWKTFFEAAQRRHVYTHAGGEVTKIYIERCLSEGIFVEKDKPTLGKILGLDIQYQTEAIRSVELVGYQVLGFLLAKLFPDGINIAASRLNVRAFDLLRHGRYKRAKLLLEYLNSDPITKNKELTAYTRLAMAINLSQAMKWLGDANFEKVLDGHDWSAVGSDFKRALLALRGEHEGLAALSKNWSSDEWFEALIWPVFRDFRVSIDFRTAFQSRFGTEYLEPGQVHELLDANQPDRKLEDALKDSLPELDIEKYVTWRAKKTG